MEFSGDEFQSQLKNMGLILRVIAMIDEVEFKTFSISKTSAPESCLHAALLFVSYSITIDYQ